MRRPIGLAGRVARFVGRAMHQDRPDSPRQLVGQGYHHRVLVGSGQHSLDPAAKRRGTLGKRSGTMDQSLPDPSRTTL